MSRHNSKASERGRYVITGGTGDDYWERMDDQTDDLELAKMIADDSKYDPETKYGSIKATVIDLDDNGKVVYTSESKASEDYGDWNKIKTDPFASNKIHSSLFNSFLKEIGAYHRWETMTQNEKIYIYQFFNRLEEGQVTVSDYKPYSYESKASEDYWADDKLVDKYFVVDPESEYVWCGICGEEFYFDDSSMIYHIPNEHPELTESKASEDLDEDKKTIDRLLKKNGSVDLNDFLEESKASEEVDYNNIGESRTARTKYECEYCNCGFKSNESLTVHHNDIHAIPFELIEGYSTENWKDVANDLIKNENKKRSGKKKRGESKANEVPFSSTDGGKIWTCPKCSQQFNEIDYFEGNKQFINHLRSHGLSDENIEKILDLDYSSNWKMYDFLKVESKASEFTPLELYETIEPLWNNLSENDRKKIIINTTNGFVGQDNNIKSNWDQIDHVTQQRIADNWDNAFNMIDEDKKTIYGLESKANEADYGQQWNTMTPEMRRNHFERVGLSGIHFNEDDEQNWADYNYGDVEWSQLTQKMQDQLKSWGVTESKANEDDYRHDFDELSSLAQNKIEDEGVTQKEWNETPEEKRKDLEDKIEGGEFNPDELFCPECGFKTIDEKEFEDHLDSHRFDTEL